MSYLNQGTSGSTYCEVITVGKSKQNYAIFMGSDPSLVTCEKTASPVGVYNTENMETPITDPNIKSVIKSWYDRVTPYSELTVRELIECVLANTILGRKLALNGLPKMTKVLASNLSAIKELMVLYKDTDSYEFLCFGYRAPIAAFLEHEQYDALYFFPERFYTAVSFESRFKNNFSLRYDNEFCEVLGLVNVGGDKISLLMPVEWKTHSEFLSLGFVEN